jgi:hypothetical protein
MEPSDIEEVFEHLEDPEELDFDNDTYREDSFLEDENEETLVSGWGTYEDYGYFVEDEY